jgi:OOP family OmpA-OmpF porin
MLNKFSKILLGATALISFAAAANAADVKPYMSGNVQYLLGDNEDSVSRGAAVKLHEKAGAGIAGQVGAKIDNFRVEGEALYLISNIDRLTTGGTTVRSDIDAKATAFMANGYYDFKNDSKFTPYIGVGAGTAHMVSSVTSGHSDTANVFAYQALAGVSYEINPHNSVSLGYRYFATEDGKFDSGDKTSFDKNIGEVGYRYTF